MPTMIRKTSSKKTVYINPKNYNEISQIHLRSGLFCEKTVHRSSVYLTLRMLINHWSCTNRTLHPEHLEIELISESTLLKLGSVSALNFKQYALYF